MKVRVSVRASESVGKPWKPLGLRLLGALRLDDTTSCDEKHLAHVEDSNQLSNCIGRDLDLAMMLSQSRLMLKVDNLDWYQQPIKTVLWPAGSFKAESRESSALPSPA